MTIIPMKKIHIVTVIICMILVWSISTLSFAANELLVGNTSKKEQIQSAINKKLDDLSRLENAIKTIEESDKEEFWDTTFNTQEAAQRATKLWDDINSVVSEIEKLQEKRKENNEHYQETMKQVRKVIIDIKLTKQAVTENVTKINIYTKNMIQLLSDIEETKLYIKNTRDTLSKLLPSLYIIQNAYINQAGSIDDLKLLIWNDTDLNTILTFDDLLQWLSIKLDQVLLDLSDAQIQYKKRLTQAHNTRKQLKKATLEYQEKITTLEEQKAYLMDFLSLYKNKKISLDKTIYNLFETRTQLEKRIAQTVDNAYVAIKHTNNGDTNALFQEFFTKIDKRDSRPNMFWWPVLPVDNIKTLFGDTFTIAWKEETSQSIHLGAEQWQELYAPAWWLVFYAQDQDSISSNWMVIIHKNWYVSVFRNMNKIFTRTGKMVERWELIWLVWWQPGTRWAWWFSDGAHVNMQIFKNGKPVDPLDIMDLSVINNPTILPDDYQVKYDIDTRMRSTVIDFSEVRFMEGNSVRERRLKFLDTVAAGPYDDIMLWEKAAEWTNVDVDLGICIGYAETSMGRHFASEHNIGNVWNNDRGDRVDKSSPLDGAKAIYDVLNNRYLGWYRTIYELSGYGNKDWAIYASSEYNWQKNVSRCLSSIKWYIVPEDYPFRTYGELVD